MERDKIFLCHHVPKLIKVGTCPMAGGAHPIQGVSPIPWGSPQPQGGLTHPRGVSPSPGGLGQVLVGHGEGVEG